MVMRFEPEKSEENDMEDPVLKNVYQPLVDATGMDPKNVARIAIDVYVPLTIFQCWLQWSLNHDAVDVLIGFAFLYFTRVRLWPLMKQGIRAAASNHGAIHLMYRMCMMTLLLVCAGQLLHTLTTGSESASAIQQIIKMVCLTLIISSIYLPMCDAPPPRRRDDRRPAYAGS
jgi:hypothetical protein